MTAALTASCGDVRGPATRERKGDPGRGTTCKSPQGQTPALGWKGKLGVAAPSWQGGVTLGRPRCPLGGRMMEGGPAWAQRPGRAASLQGTDRTGTAMAGAHGGQEGPAEKCSEVRLDGT